MTSHLPIPNQIPGPTDLQPPAPVLRARCPEDVLALVPVLLGFEPADSVVMLTFGGQHQFHARIDAPPDPAAFPEIADALLRPALRHAVSQVVLVLYLSDGEAAEAMAPGLVDVFESAGITVADCLRAHAGRWFSPAWERAGVGPEGVAYAVDDHPFRARAVLEGRVTLASREQLAATIAADPARVAATRAALAEVDPLNHAALDRLLQRALKRGAIEEPEDLASLLLSLPRPSSRDRTWPRMTLEDARVQVGLWTQIVTAAPDDLVAHPAAVLAFACWLAGDGALAWCAVDRCLEQDPDNHLGTLVASLLSEAVPPYAWGSLREQLQ